jgi:hypothetical protein
MYKKIFFHIVLVWGSCILLQRWNWVDLSQSDTQLRPGGSIVRTRFTFNNYNSYNGAKEVSLPLATSFAYVVIIVAQLGAHVCNENGFGDGVQ